MPELPEVETVVRGLRDGGLPGRRIISARVYWPRSVQGLPPHAFCRRLPGLRIRALERRGKYIVMRLSDGGTLLVHLRMSGRLSLVDGRAPRDRHEHVVLGLDDGRDLRFRDTRKFGRWLLTDTPQDQLGRLGPEPLDDSFTLKRFQERLLGRGGMLKPLLLDQAFIAGMGNIYVDEALWLARLHPQRSAASLAATEPRRLYRALRAVLRSGIAAAGTSLGTGGANFYGVSGQSGRNQERLKVFRRSDEPCPRCRAPIIRLKVAQRSTHICPRCQKSGRSSP
jgi:formamidopyrimidine-DNA glycosylase